MVALDSEVRVREVGQAIHGKTTEPVYAFDKLLIPAGTVVNGKISAIDGVPAKIWVMDATDGNFFPARHVHVQFNELVMSDGRHVALQTVVFSGAGWCSAVCVGQREGGTEKQSARRSVEKNECNAAGDPATVERFTEADS
jgi:hypothetical protein